MKRHTIYTLLALLFIPSIQAQTDFQELLKSHTPMTPEAAALSKYIEFPVSHNTGLVNINIPLYEVKVGDLTLPITLSYHSSGIKVSELSGWVGSGWTLNAEPSITRTVEDAPDEDYYLHNTLPGEFSSTVYQAWASNTIDFMPDKFYYQLLDRSAGFFFEKVGNTAANKIVNHPYEPVKISERMANAGHNFAGFRIRDNQGLVYTFAGYDSGVLQPSEVEVVTSGSNSIVTRWKAKSIRSSSTTAFLDFSYHNHETNTTNFHHHKIIVEEPLNSDKNTVERRAEYMRASTTYTGAQVKITCGRCGSRNIASSGLPNNPGSYSIQEGKIKKIQFNTGYITFTKSGDKLESIHVYNNNDELIRHIKFYQSQLGLDTKRRKLDKIHIYGSDNATVEKYAFTYYMPELVPKITDTRTDYWGYNNNPSPQYDDFNIPVPKQSINIGTCLICRQFGSYLSLGGGGDKKANEWTKYGVLTSVKYPTGGETKLEYELNKYQDKNNNPVYGGGLRIKKITEKPSDISSDSIVKEFTYGTYNGYGTPINPYNLSHYVSEEIATTSSGVYPFTSRKTYSANIAGDYFLRTGPAVRYSNVTITIGDSLVTKYEYNSSFGSYHEDDLRNRFKIDTWKDWAAGSLRLKEEYKKLPDGNLSLLKSTETINDNLKLKSTKVYRIRRDLVEERDGYDQSSNYYVYDFNIETGCERPGDEEEIYYFGDKKIKTERFHFYKRTNYSIGNEWDDVPHINPIEIYEQKGSDYSVTEFTYLQDDPTATNAETLFNNGKVNTLLSKTETVNGTKVVIENKYNRNYTLGDDMVQIPALGEIHQKIADNTSEKRYEVLKYDNNGNPVYLMKDNSYKVVYLWSYCGQYPVMEIKNATYEEVAGVLGSNNISQLAGNTYPSDELIWSLGSLLRNSLSTSEVTTYTHKPLIGVSSITDSKGATVYYEYDPLGRLKEIYRYKESVTSNNSKEIITSNTYHYNQ